MGKASELPTDWKDQLVSGRRKEVSQKYRTLSEEAEAIPLRAKTQYPTYIEGRMLHLLRGISEVENISVQDLIRMSLQEGIDRRMRLAEKQRGKGGGTKKKKPASKKSN